MTDTIVGSEPIVTPDDVTPESDESLPEGVFGVHEATPEEEITAPQPKRRKREKSSEDIGPSKPPKETPRKQPGKYVDPMMQLYGAISLPISMVDPTCGTAIGESAEQCALMWDELAQTSPAVRRMLEAVMQGGAWGGVVLAHVPIMIAVMGHHMPERLPNYLQAFKNIADDGETERGEDAAA